VPGTLIVGIGSEHGDDRVGWIVADKLRRQLIANSNVEVRTATVPLDLIDWLEGVDELQICDACESSGGDEEVHRFAWNDQSFVAGSRGVFTERRATGTHGFGVVEVLQLLKAMGRLPKSVVIWAIPGKLFDVNSQLSPGTGEFVQHVVEKILSELDVIQ
jgi:hydrogenase maturation protease